MDYSIPCTGDVVAGDKIVFDEAVFSGSFKKPKFVRNRKIYAEVIKESYGTAKQQHTFTLMVIESDDATIKPGSKILRKGRNIYREGTFRKPWSDESQREIALNEKHTRGDRARAKRDLRRQSCDW